MQFRFAKLESFTPSPPLQRHPQIIIKSIAIRTSLGNLNCELQELKSPMAWQPSSGCQPFLAANESVRRARLKQIVFRRGWLVRLWRALQVVTK
jgi:hypothetical protein